MLVKTLAGRSEGKRLYSQARESLRQKKKTVEMEAGVQEP